MRVARLLLTSCLCMQATFALAEPPPTSATLDRIVRISQYVKPDELDMKAPRFAFSAGHVRIAPKTIRDAIDGVHNQVPQRTGEVIGLSTDKKTAWYAGDLVEYTIECGMAPCPPPRPKPPVFHAGIVFEKGGDGRWYPIAWHVDRVVTSAQQAASVKAGHRPPAIPRDIAGAEDAVRLFESTIGSPATLAKTISTRSDVVLHGSEANERVVGGAQVRATLESWQLGFKVRDGIQAGTASSGTVVWIAANVDAVSAARPKDKPVPYRAFFVYEKTGTDWRVVHAGFSYVVAVPDP